MTKMDKASTFVGDTITPVKKPKTRAQKIAEYRRVHKYEYEKACSDAQCTCTPTRAQMLIIDNYQSPPID
jgi:hypothetical protein